MAALDTPRFPQDSRAYQHWLLDGVGTAEYTAIDVDELAKLRADLASAREVIREALFAFSGWRKRSCTCPRCAALGRLREELEGKE